MGLGSNISIDFVMNISIFDIYDKITSVLIGSLAFMLLFHQFICRVSPRLLILTHTGIVNFMFRDMLNCKLFGNEVEYELKCFVFCFFVEAMMIEVFF